MVVIKLCLSVSSRHNLNSIRIAGARDMLPLVYTLSLKPNGCELQKRHGSCCYTRTQQTNAVSSTPRKVKLTITDIRSSVVDADIHAA